MSTVTVDPAPPENQSLTSSVTPTRSRSLLSPRSETAVPISVTTPSKAKARLATAAGLYCSTQPVASLPGSGPVRPVVGLRASRSGAAAVASDHRAHVAEESPARLHTLSARP